MKTTDATVLEEPKARRRATEETIEPAIESRPRPTTGVREAKIYIDGKFYSEANAKVSVFDHGLLYGDGIFKGIRFYNGRVFRLEQHLERLWNSARSICLEIPISRQEMTEALHGPIRQNHLHAGYIRLHARSWQPRLESGAVQKSKRHHHCGDDRPLSRGLLPERAEHCYCRNAP